MPRFYFRTIVGLAAPLLIAAYFFTIWRIYLLSIDPTLPFIVGPPGALYVNYSWFLAGVVGINLSMYGLAGVEAALLMHPAWAPRDALALIMHTDATWSGPGGWLLTLKRIVALPSDRHSRWPSRLWLFLFLPSMLAFAAWPLSGLAFQTTTGFIQGASVLAGNGTAPKLTGFSYTNINQRNAGDAISAAQTAWQFGLDSKIPGMGIVYTAEGADKSGMPFLQKLPVTLPTDDGVSKIFLTSQGDYPIEGTAWGLVIEYNCSAVSSLAEMTVLSHRNQSASDPFILSGSTSTRLYQAANDSTIIAANETLTGFANMQGVVEYGYRTWPNTTALEAFNEDPEAQFTKALQCYYNQAENVTGDYPGIDDEPTVFEMLVWQNIPYAGFLDPAPVYDLHLDHNLTELFGAYNLARFSNTSGSQPMSAVGARCTSRASVGTASVDAAHSTFRGFVRSDTPISFQINRCAMRFGAQAMASLFGGVVTPPSIGTGSGGGDWLGTVFKSVGAPPPFYGQSAGGDPIDAGTGQNVQLTYLQADDLRRSLLRMHAAYAVQLMYNGGQPFTAVDGSHVTGEANPNVTMLQPGTVLAPGVVPAELPAALFLAWAVLGPLACLLYGFRRRWAPTLDGYRLFRLGADLDEAVKERLAAYPNTGAVEECAELRNIPGLVGDTRPGAYVGHVGLTDGVVARSDKKYD